jgi:hypothetical protein
MDSNYDVYDYDKSIFFKLLEANKFKFKFELVQQKQGVIVCPLELKSNQIDNLKKQNDLIDSHLYLPSPFYKNHYIPLNSLIALSSLNNLLLSSSSSAVISNYSSFLLDHSQKIYLILNQPTGEQQSELLLMSNRVHICKNVKLLSIQTGYTLNNKTYKILIVNKPLYFNLSSFNNDVKLYNQSRYLNELPEEPGCDNDSNGDEDQQDEQEIDNFRHGLSNRRPVPASSNRNSTVMSQFSFANVNDVKTFGQCIDFMHDTLCIVDESQIDEAADLLSDEDYDSRIVRRNSIKFANKKLKECFIGEDLLNELELFRKTYIILPTHLINCGKKLKRMHGKYVSMFLRSFGYYLKTNSIESSDIDPNLELMVAIACETTICGCLYSKVWPIVCEMNSPADKLIHEKCRQLFEFLKLEDEDSSNSLNKKKEASVEWLELSSAYFQLEKKYFSINLKPVLKEIKRVPLLNNPYEKLECIKTTTDLLNNELTISLMNNNSNSGTESSPSGNNSSVMITSDILIPLFAFILIKSNISCFRSIIFFIDTFHFSFQSSAHSTSHNSTLLAELSFFMTTFKASVQFIEASNVYNN